MTAGFPSMRLYGALASVLAVAASDAAAEPADPIVLWPKGAPGEKGDVGPERRLPMRAGDATVRITDVTAPVITVYRPPADKNTGAAVLICPGGGYAHLAYNKEGAEAAEWLNSIGVTGIVLKYRVPGRKGRERHAAPLEDAQRAMGLIRRHAKEWGVDPQRVGVLGFSAGGHVAAVLSTNHEKRVYEATDEADRLSCRPDFSLLVYPAYLTVAKEGDRLAPEVKVAADTPRTFLVQTQDDGVRVESSVFYYLALKAAKVSAELHVYPTGGHGYGLRPSPHAVSTWPQRAEQWMRSLGLLEKSGAAASADPKAAPLTDVRKPADDTDLRYWLGNMAWHHRFTAAEMSAVTGLGAQEIETALKRFDIRPDNRPKRAADAPLLVLPYPGGRHPRIGFLDGALRPQRETKVSVFCPWDPDSYVVVDVPEAVWSNLGLTYLAHTHVPTVWSKKGVELDRLEWTRRDDGSLAVRRRLPDGIELAVEVRPTRDEVRFEMSLTNGTAEKLTDLRVQMCAMLKGAAGFAKQTNDNKVFAAPYAACRSAEGDNWIIMAWEPNHRTWGNAPCPCLHSDPKFPDCAPGETVRVVGRLWFYHGSDIKAEFGRLDGTGWRQAAVRPKG